MKKGTGILTVVILLLAALSLQAQNQKIGFVDSEEIMDRMPEYTGIEQQLQLLSESWRDEIREMEEEIQQLEEEFQAREVLYTDEVREQRLIEIETRKREKDQFIEDKFGPNGDYFQQQKELLEPIQRKIFDAINRVANRDNFDFVFDRAEDVRFLFAKPEWNLNREVMLELGIDPEMTRN